MRRIARGDVSAFEQLYDRHATAAFSLARRMLRDSQGAEDVCQEAFLVIWRRASTFDPARGAVRAWLLAIVRNRAIDAIRHRATHPAQADDGERLLEDTPAAQQTDAQAIARVQAQAVRVTLDSLPVKQRQAIVLAYYHGLTHTEIAELLDQPLGTVKGRLRLGVQKLQCHLPAMVGE